MSPESKEVIIYTDGACQGNPGPGGYGVVLLHGKHRKELSGGFRLTTNNRMEIMALIAGLSALKQRCRATLYSDSRYVVDAINLGWAKKWRAKGWKRGKDGAAKNVDLWKQVLGLLEKHEVTVKWVPGHAGNPENERCDRLAVAAAEVSDLPPDEAYENPPDPDESLF